MEYNIRVMDSDLGERVIKTKARPVVIEGFEQFDFALREWNNEIDEVYPFFKYAVFEISSGAICGKGTTRKGAKADFYRRVKEASEHGRTFEAVINNFINEHGEVKKQE